MTISTQTFRGETHRITFRYEPAQTAGRPLVVSFDDIGGQPQLAHVGELSPLDLNRLYVLDDFGPFIDHHGYVGCWYLGEGRCFTFAQDVALLVRDVQRAGALRQCRERSRWDAARAGTPRSGCRAARVGQRAGGDAACAPGTVLNDDGLAPAAQFIAGGDEPGDLRWLDRLLSAEIARRSSFRRCGCTPASANPPMRSTCSRWWTPQGQWRPLRAAGGRPRRRRPGRTAFAAELFWRLGAQAQAAMLRVALPTAQVAATCRWARRSRPSITATADGLHCVLAAPGPEAYYAGVNVPLGPFDTLVLNFAFRCVGGLDSVRVDAVDAAGARVYSLALEHRPQRGPGGGRAGLSAAPGLAQRSV